MALKTGELKYNYANLPLHDLHDFLEEVSRYKEVEELNITDNSPLFIFLNRGSGFFGIDLGLKAVTEIIDSFLELGCNFDDDLCIKLLQGNLDQNLQELIKKYNKSFNYNRYYDKFNKAIEKTCYTDIKDLFFFFDQFSGEVLSKDKCSLNKSMVLFFKVFIDAAYKTEGLSAVRFLLEKIEKEKVDLSSKAREIALFQIFNNIHNYEFNTVKYFLDDPGINLNVVDKDGDTFEDLLLAEKNWTEKYFTIKKEKFEKIFNYFELLKMNQDSSDEFNL